MATSLTKRRVVTVDLEALGVGGTGEKRGIFPSGGISAAASALPTIRDADITRFEPTKVERETLRLSLTGVPDIYAGQAIVEFTVIAEFGGIPSNTSASTSFQTPVWGDVMRSAGFEEVSNTSSPPAPSGNPVIRNPRLYTGFTNMTAGNGAAMRHGETILVDYATSGDIGFANTFVVGDTFSDDDQILIEEPAGSVAGAGAITLTTQSTGSNKSTSAGTVVRRTPILIAFRLQSDVNKMETISAEMYLDGKRMRIKGCMSNVEFRFAHGDVIVAEFKILGVMVPLTGASGSPGYADVAIPTNANEVHNVPPTFLGKDVRFSTIDGTKRYGKDTGSAFQLGSLNTLTIRTGNEISMRENSLDPAGISFAQIVDRKPSGSFNPDEVANADFDFVAGFVGGVPHRLKAFISGISAAPFIDGNSFDFIAPGIVFSGLADQEREKINIWDAAFDLTGGDYDTSAAGELPGNDNEFTILCR